MNKLISYNISVSLFLMATVVSACQASDFQTEEAAKIVDQANKKLEAAKELYGKTETRQSNLFSTKIKTGFNRSDYKARMSEEAKSIAADYEKVTELLIEISKQYTEVSRMDLSDRFKEYAKLKSEEFAKRLEAVNARKNSAQAFIEIDDPKKMMTQFNDNNSKSDRLLKEAEEIALKAKKIE